MMMFSMIFSKQVTNVTYSLRDLEIVYTANLSSYHVSDSMMNDLDTSHPETPPSSFQLPYQKLVIS